MSVNKDTKNKYISANVKQLQIVRESLANPEKFWLDQAYSAVEWSRRPSKAYSFPNPLKQYCVDWFPDGKINVCYNLLDRHVLQGRSEQPAIIYDSPVTKTKRVYSYGDLLEKVKEFSRVLAKNGVCKGDTVIIYMPMIPQTIIAMLACTRIGAIHSVVFGGFASPELAKRINNCKPKVVLSATCGIERSDKIVKYIPLLSKALKISKHKPKAVIVYQREQLPVLLDPKLGFKCWYEEVASVQELTDAPSAVVDSNHPLYILCTSGTTGLPKGVIRPCGPHLVSLSWTIRNMFGIKPGEVFFCASDLGWVVGHTFTCYGPLLEGCTTVLYEGKPVKTPDAGSFFRVIQEYGASIFYTAPTALVVLRKEDKEHNIVRKYNLDSIRGYFMAGERCSTEIYKWWVEHTTGKRVDGERYHYDEIKGIAVDHWWQTESGSPMTGICIGVSEDPKEIAPIQFGSAGMPLAGVDLRVVKAKDHLNEDEVVHSHIEEADFNEVGDIVVKLPLPPGFFTGIWENKKVFFSSYFRKYPGYYDTGDMGFVDKDGYVHITSRCDDVINVAAHRFSTCTFEEVVLEQNGISEACVVGRPHDIKGQIPIIFAVLEKNMSAKEKSELVRSIVTKIRADIGPVASMLPENVIFVPRLPKNRSGKILRRTIRVLIDYAGKHRNDLSEKLPIPMPPTIEDPDVLKDTWLIIASLVNPGSVELRSKM